MLLASRRRRIAGLTATALAVSALVAMSDVGEAAAAQPDSSVAVSLGDSFVSGEGARWSGNAAPKGGPSAWGTDRLCILRWWGCEPRPGGVYRGGPTAACHRSDVAEIEVAPLGELERFNLACSGAEVRDIYRRPDDGPAESLPSQVDRLQSIARSHPVSLVVISVGANDLGFSRLVRNCASAWLGITRSGCRAAGGIAIARNLPGLKGRLRYALERIVTAMERAGRPRDSWQLVVQGYASPLPEEGEYRYPQESARRLSPGGCPFGDSDSNWAKHTLVRALNATLEAAAEAQGARFLDLSDAFAGHAVCDGRVQLVREDGPSGVRSEWFRYLVPCCGGMARESLHPNSFGHRAMGVCLARFFGLDARRGSCQPRVGAGPAAMKVEAG